MAALILIALTTLGSAAIALTRRNLVHSALLLIASWAGIAAFYLWAGAEFIAFAQVLIYVGAVSMIVLFAVLLTRRSRADLAISADSLSRGVSAILVGGLVLGTLFGAVASTRLTGEMETGSIVPVKQVGLDLMANHAVALLTVGALLTVALLGAIIIAASEPAQRPSRTTGNGRGR